MALLDIRVDGLLDVAGGIRVLPPFPEVAGGGAALLSTEILMIVLIIILAIWCGPQRHLRPGALDVPEAGLLAWRPVRM